MGIVAILFISLFALDTFQPNLSIWQQIRAFFIHLIPSFILLALLLIAWKWENIGSILFLLIGLGFMPFIFLKNYKMNHSVWKSIGIIAMITLPPVVDILFIISYFQNKKIHINK